MTLGAAERAGMEWVVYEEPFDLRLTLECGQVFHWTAQGGGWAGVIGEVPVYLEQGDGGLWVTAGTAELVRHYLALDHPLEEIYGSFPNDVPLGAALGVCRGLRVVRQPRWECVATFITSSMKQVAHIAQISHTLRRRFGQEVGVLGGEPQWAYPEPARLAEVGEGALRECALGYRAANLWKAAVMVAEGRVDLEAIRTMDDAGARAELLKLPGVGVKVANCVLLFAYERLKAFPIDVWIERALRELYFVGKRRVTTERLRRFSETYFGPYGGYAQQYLFHYARTRPREPKRRVKKS